MNFEKKENLSVASYKMFLKEKKKDYVSVNE